MLVLSRTQEESIIIGDDVEVTVLEVRGKTVRIGITAPSNIPVDRAEIYVKRKRDEQSGASDDQE